jgi:hypothetical protein
MHFSTHVHTSEERKTGPEHQQQRLLFPLTL